MGEVAGLQRRHVVLVNGVIKFRQVVVELSSGELRISPPKTNAGRRTVYLPEVVLQACGSISSPSRMLLSSQERRARSCAGQPFKRRKGLAAASLTGRNPLVTYGTPATIGRPKPAQRCVS
ncbi:MAG TPA: hypothetical protein VGD71_09260 [Kribbella sp.]|jgi:hypothetical protein